MNKDSKIFVTGHRGLVGSAICRQLATRGYTNVLKARRDQLDLRDQRAVNTLFQSLRPEYVIHAAGTVGGIEANRSRPAEFGYDNLMIQATVLRSAWEWRVKKLLYLGSSCIYPRDCPQPIKEEYLLTGTLEPTNEAYALAKITGVKSCQYYRQQYGCNFIAAMPTNLYGPGDNFDLETSHVVPALIRKFHDAKVTGRPEVVVWGSGTPRREFMHVDDLADACLFLMDSYDGEGHINVGTDREVSICELAKLVRTVVYPEACIVYDTSKPDGAPRKLLDSSRLNNLGWRAKINLELGIFSTYEWYLEHEEAMDHA